jgi:hypothetical protein
MINIQFMSKTEQRSALVEGETGFSRSGGGAGISSLTFKSVGVDQRGPDSV